MERIMDYTEGYVKCDVCTLYFRPESTRQTRHDQCHAEYRKAYKRHHSKVYDSQKHRLSDVQLSEVRDHAMSDARDALKDG